MIKINIRTNTKLINIRNPIKEIHLNNTNKIINRVILIEMKNIIQNMNIKKIKKEQKDHMQEFNLKSIYFFKYKKDHYKDQRSFKYDKNKGRLQFSKI